jgi:hypothetical protein
MGFMPELIYPNHVKIGKRMSAYFTQLSLQIPYKTFVTKKGTDPE